MTNSSFDALGRQWAWDATSIKMFEECPRKYQYRMIDGWTPSGGKSVHLRFGAIYATAMEHFAKYRAEGRSREDAILDVVHEALIASWDYAYTDSEGAMTQDPTKRIPGSGKPWDTGNANKTRSTLIRTIVWYFEHFEHDLEVITLSNGKPAVEYSFKLPITDEIVFCGHIDKLVEYGGAPLVVDQKTTSSTVGSYYFDQYSPDTQMSMYTYAGSIIYNTPVRGVMIDAAQIVAGFSRFERGFALRTPSQLEEWVNMTLTNIERARRMTEVGHFPMNTTACNNFGGCEFRSICSKAPEIREQFLKGNFTKAPKWDPAKER